MLVNMRQIVRSASRSSRIVPGFNVFGYEDAKAIICAAQHFDAPVILMSNSDAIAHMDPVHSAALFRSQAESASVPVAIHLDHARTIELITRAVAAGYTSVMYDGSALPLQQNIEKTLRVLEAAARQDVSVEAELGSVAYTDRNEEIITSLTSPEEVAQFTRAAPVDALAVSVGSLHRMQTKGARLDFPLIQAIEQVTDVPLVIHGASGVVDEDMKRLLSTQVAKVNIGTALRMAFGEQLKEEIELHPYEFDRVKLFKRPMAEVQAAAEEKYRLLGW